jgi:hypothetical protein
MHDLLQILESNYLDKFVPTTRDDNWILSVWRESNTAHPVSVTVILEREERRKGERGKENREICITDYCYS